MIFFILIMHIIYIKRNIHSPNLASAKKISCFSIMRVIKHFKFFAKINSKHM